MNSGERNDGHQKMREMVARWKAKDAGSAAKPNVPVQAEAATFKATSDSQGDLVPKSGPVVVTSEAKSAPADISALIGRKVRLFTAVSKLRDVAEITPMSSILFNSLEGSPPFWIQHKASDAREQCNGVSRTGGSFKFVSDEGLLITVSGGNHVMEATIGEPVGVFPVFASPKPTPIAAYAEKAKEELWLGHRLLVTKGQEDRFLALGNNFFLKLGGCVFNIEGDTVTDALQGYRMYYVNPDRVDRRRFLGMGHVDSGYYERSHHFWGKSTEDVPYQREFGLGVGQQLQFALGDRTVMVSLSQVGKDLLSTDVKIY